MAPTRSPSLTRFLSDFTLGFSDGLTVPFALTAGLSSLGRADTVIYAGLAELCAGSISMGIGGYLSALDEVPSQSTKSTTGYDSAESDIAEEEQGMLMRETGGSSSDSDAYRQSSDEKDTVSPQEQLILDHLQPLFLSPAAAREVIAALQHEQGGLSRAARQIQLQHDLDAQDSLNQDTLPIWPVASGLSISLGYVVGGVIPLLPYLFAATVGLALRWSIALCLIALMSFGSGKSWLLGGQEKGWKRCIWAGVQMMILGSVAAGAAVGCVQLLGSATEAGG